MSGDGPDDVSPPVTVERDGPVTVITINRPQVRNAVDGPTAELLLEAFTEFAADESAAVAILTGADGTFCAGADLGAISGGRGNRVVANPEVSGPMGPTRLELGKPVIAAVEGFAVAGGLELAVWCDLRVVSESSVFGVYCRRWGVPLVDGGTVRLPRLIGESRAMDMILTGRAVGATEALQFGLANRVVPDGEALAAAIRWAHELAALPQVCLRNDLRSTRGQWGLTPMDALMVETELGLETLRSPETIEGAERFVGGAGRGGAPAPL